MKIHAFFQLCAYVLNYPKILYNSAWKVIRSPAQLYFSHSIPESKPNSDQQTLIISTSSLSGVILLLIVGLTLSFYIRKQQKTARIGKYLNSYTVFKLRTFLSFLVAFIFCKNKHGIAWF